METAQQRTARSETGATGRPRSAVELFGARVKSSGNTIAMRWKEGGAWRAATYSEWERAAREIGAGLASLGLQPQERACLLAGTRPEWMHCDVGVLMAGAVPVPIYQSNVPHECEYVINDCAAKVVFVENPHQLDKLMKVRDQLGGVTRVVYFDATARLDKPDAQGRQQVGLDEVLGSQSRDWVMSLADLRAAGRAWDAAHPGELERRWAAIEPSHTFTIVYTSGTTGPPKGAVLTHANIVWECEAMRDAIPVGAGDEQLLFLPLAHIFARALEWQSINNGGSIAFAESINTIKANLVEVRPTLMCAVPRVLEKVYLGILGNRNAAPPARQKIFDWAFSVGREVSRRKQAKQPIGGLLALKNRVAHKLVFSKITDLLGGRMRFIVSGGAPLSKEIAEFFHAAGVLILEGWGLTETTAGTCINRLDAYAFGTVGRPVPGTEIKIAPDGEILVRSGAVMQGYYNKPEATREVIDPDGWFHTGDIGQLEDGFLRITDRKKDIIVSAGGKNIAPQNLENALKATPYISQVMVHGDKRPYLTALITINEENVRKWAEQTLPALAAALLAELAAHPQVRGLVQQAVDSLNAREPSYSTIKKFHILPADFSQETGELTPTLKVKRKFTSEKHQALLDAFYAN